MTKFDIKGSVTIDKIKISTAAQNALRGLVVNIDLTKVEAALRQLSKMINDVFRPLTKSTAQSAKYLQTLTRNLNSTGGAAKKAAKEVKLLDTLFFQVLRKASAFRVSTVFINGFFNALNFGIKFALEFDTALRDINKILLVSDKSLSKFGAGITQIAREYNISVEDIASAAKTAAQAGFFGLNAPDAQKTAETLDIVSRAAFISKTTTLDFAQALDSLIVFSNQAGLSIQETTGTLLKLSAIEDASAIDTQDLAEAFKRAGTSITQAFGGSLDLAFGSLGALIERTQQSGAVIGTFFKTLIARLSGGNREATAAFEKLGISITDKLTNQIKTPFELLTELKGKLKTLGPVEAGETLAKVGGVRQIELLKALLDTLPDSFSNATGRAQELADVASKGFARAIEKFNQEFKKTEKTINDVITTYKEFVQVFMESDLGKSIKESFVGIGQVIVDALTGKDIQGFFNNLLGGLIKGGAPILGSIVLNTLLGGKLGGLAGAGATRTSIDAQRAKLDEARNAKIQRRDELLQQAQRLRDKTQAQIDAAKKAGILTPAQEAAKLAREKAARGSIQKRVEQLNKEIGGVATREQRLGAGGARRYLGEQFSQRAKLFFKEQFFTSFTTGLVAATAGLQVLSQSLEKSSNDVVAGFGAVLNTFSSFLMLGPKFAGLATLFTAAASLVSNAIDASRLTSGTAFEQEQNVGKAFRAIKESAEGVGGVLASIMSLGTYRNTLDYGSLTEDFIQEEERLAEIRTRFYKQTPSGGQVVEITDKDKERVSRLGTVISAEISNSVGVVADAIRRSTTGSLEPAAKEARKAWANIASTITPEIFQDIVKLLGQQEFRKKFTLPAALVMARFGEIDRTQIEKLQSKLGEAMQDVLMKMGEIEAVRKPKIDLKSIQELREDEQELAKTRLDAVEAINEMLSAEASFLEFMSGNKLAQLYQDRQNLEREFVAKQDSLNKEYRAVLIAAAENQRANLANITNERDVLAKEIDILYNEKINLQTARENRAAQISKLNDEIKNINSQLGNLRLRAAEPNQFTIPGMDTYDATKAARELEARLRDKIKELQSLKTTPFASDEELKSVDERLKKGFEAIEDFNKRLDELNQILIPSADEILALRDSLDWSTDVSKFIAIISETRKDVAELGAKQLEIGLAKSVKEVTLAEKKLQFAEEEYKLKKKEVEETRKLLEEFTTGQRSFMREFGGTVTKTVLGGIVNMSAIPQSKQFTNPSRYQSEFGFTAQDREASRAGYARVFDYLTGRGYKSSKEDMGLPTRTQKIVKRPADIGSLGTLTEMILDMRTAPFALEKDMRGVASTITEVIKPIELTFSRMIADAQDLYSMVKIGGEERKAQIDSEINMLVEQNKQAISILLEKKKVELAVYDSLISKTLVLTDEQQKSYDDTKKSIEDLSRRQAALSKGDFSVLDQVIEGVDNTKLRAALKSKTDFEIENLNKLREASKQYYDKVQSYIKDLISTTSSIGDTAWTIRNNIKSMNETARAFDDAIKGKLLASMEAVGQAKEGVSSAMSALISARDALYNALESAAGAFVDFNAELMMTSYEIDVLYGKFSGTRDAANALSTVYDKIIANASKIGASETKIAELRNKLAEEQLSMFQNMLNEAQSRAEKWFSSSAQERVDYVRGLQATQAVLQGGVSAREILSLPQEIRQQMLAALELMPEGATISGMTREQARTALLGAAYGESRRAGIEGLSDIMQTVAELMTRVAETNTSQLISAGESIAEARKAVSAAEEQVQIAKDSYMRAQQDAIIIQNALRQVSSSVDNEVGALRKEIQRKLGEVELTVKDPLQKIAEQTKIMSDAQQAVQSIFSDAASRAGSVTGDTVIQRAATELPKSMFGEGTQGGKIMKDITTAMNASASALSGEVKAFSGNFKVFGDSMAKNIEVLQTVVSELMKKAEAIDRDVTAQITIDNQQTLNINGADNFITKLREALDKQGWLTKEDLTSLEATLTAIVQEMINSGSLPSNYRFIGGR